MTTKIETTKLRKLTLNEIKAKRFSTGRFLLWLGLTITLIGTLTYLLQHTPVMSRFDARQPGLYISLVGIAVCGLGFALEKRDGVIWHKSLGVKILSISLVLTALYVNHTFLAFQQEEVQFTNGEVRLAGTLLIPNGAGPHPALVMIHGSGEAVRMGNFAEAQSLARAGVAVLIFDKRGSGASVGGHPRYDGYQALARDGVAAINFLRQRSDIDPNQVGLWGTSEGGWTAPMVAAQVDPAFLIIISGGPLTPEEQGNFDMENQLRRQGLSDEGIKQALALNMAYNAYIRTGQGRDELLASVEQAQGTEWFEAAYQSEITVPDYEDFSEHAQWWQDHMDIDVAPLLEQMDFPILYVLGANDSLIPASRVKTQVESILSGSGHEDFAVVIFPEATHNLMMAPIDCRLCLPDEALGPFLPLFAPGYLDTVSEWVTHRVETRG